MARLRLSLTAVQQPAGGSVAAAAAGGAGGGVGNAAAGGPGANGPAAGAAGAGQNGAANDDSDEESDEEDVGGLGFNPEDADYCYGWLARLLQVGLKQPQDVCLLLGLLGGGWLCVRWFGGKQVRARPCIA
jgi:hypothetical protein